MDPLLSEMWLIDAPGTVEFFATSLGDVIEDQARDTRSLAVPRDEFLYVSGALAEFALVADHGAEHLPLAGTLRELHDLFVTDLSTWQDRELMEAAGVQALMLTGFFAGGMRQRHNLDTYVCWGRFFFDRAASGTSGPKRAVLGGMSRHFPVWRHHLERLHVQLWEDSHLLALEQPTVRFPAAVLGRPDAGRHH